MRHRVVSESHDEPAAAVVEVDAVAIATEFNDLYSRLTPAHQVHVMQAAIESMRELVAKTEQGSGG